MQRDVDEIALRERAKMMDGMAPRIGIPMGDPAGVGAELLARLLDESELMERAAVTVVGDRRVLQAGEAVAGCNLHLPSVSLAETARAAPGKPVFVDLEHLNPASIPLGEASAAGGAFAMRNFREALLMAKDGGLDGVMFMPFNKLALKLAGNPYPDEIRWAAHVLDWSGSCSEYNRLDGLWNARVTSHEPLGRVAGLITRDRVLAAIRASLDMLRSAGVESPRLAVAALNPHAGEGGLFGREEIEVIEPAIAEARNAGLAVEGPFPSDTPRREHHPPAGDDSTRRVRDNRQHKPPLLKTLCQSLDLVGWVLASSLSETAEARCWDEF